MKIFKLTDTQKTFLFERKIKVGGLYLLPRWGFTIYTQPSYSTGQYLDTNPFTKSLDHERIVVKEIVGDFCRVNFTTGKKSADGFIETDDLKYRDNVEICLMYFFCYIPMVVYNLFKK